MKHIFLLFSISIAALFSSCNLLDSEAPKRQGWDEDTPLYGNVESVTVTEYDREDRFGEVVRGGIHGCQKYYFNTEGDVVEEAHYNSDGSLREKYTYQYDSRGNKIEQACYKSDGSLSSKCTYKYDSSGNKIEQAYYNSDGSLWHKYTYKYDSRGNMIEEATYDSDGSLRYKHSYKYDSSGNKIEKAEYRGEALIPRSLTVYEITYSN